MERRQLCHIERLEPALTAMKSALVLLADAMLLGYLRNRVLVRFAAKRDHLFFRGSGLSHTRLV